MPTLRFPEFKGEWIQSSLQEMCIEFKSGYGITSEKISEVGSYPVYGGNGLRGYTDSFTHDGNYLLIGRQGALCGNINRSCGKSYISEHAIAVLANEQSDTEWLAQRLEYLELNRLSESSAQPGLAVNKLLKLKIFAPKKQEQTKIASFLTAVDDKIHKLTRKKELLEQYKKGVMQKIFSREIRFKDEEAKDYPDWEKRRLREVLFEHGKKSEGMEEVFSVSVHKGVVNQIDHLGRSFAAKTTLHYNLVMPYDIIYTKSPTGDFPFGIIKQSKVKTNVIVSPLYGVFTPETPSLGVILDTYFSSVKNTYNYLHSIIQKGAKNTMNITNDIFLSKSLNLPVSHTEQQEIASFVSAIDQKINQLGIKLEKMQTWKKGLLQQLFV